MTPNDTQSKFIQAIQRRLVAITEPHETLGGYERQRARLLITMLLVLVPVAIFAVVAVLIGDVIRELAIGNSVSVDSEYYSSSTAMMIVIVAYPISRTRLYPLAKWTIILAALVAVTVAVIGVYPNNTEGDLQGLYFVTVSIFFSGLLASSRATVTVGLLAFVSVAVMSVISTGWTFFDAIRPLVLIMIVTPAMSVGSAIREYYQGEVEKQVKTLEVAEEALVKMNNSLAASVGEATRELRIQRDRAEAANEAKTIFLANMSHELRTPLNAILGFTQILEQDTTLTDKQCQHINTIADSGNILLGLINDVLEMSKIEAGQTTLDNIAFDLRQMLATIDGVLRSRAEDKNIRFTFYVASDVPQFVTADESKLRQILLNLLDNAIKYTEQGSVVFTLHYKDNTLHAKINDTGLGISKEEQKTLFQSFTQTTSGRKVQQGTGLGLAIVKQFVTLMGGTIKVSSSLNEGTEFSVVIPVEHATASDSDGSGNFRRVLGIKTEGNWDILVVDDNESNRALIHEWLVPVGFRLYEATNGQDAVALWKQVKPQFIWMDMRMPIMDGYKATQQIRNLDKGHDTVIVALTASAFEHDREQVLSVGCNDFVRKPVRESVIFEKMAQYLNLSYRYADDENLERMGHSAVRRLNRESFANVPQNLREQLREAAIVADVRTLNEIILDVIVHDPSLADGLEELVVNFRFDILHELLQEESLQS